MPFGLCNAPATFQRTMDVIFIKERSRFVLTYLDVIIVYSESKDEHIKHLEIVMGRIRASGLSLNISKCHFFEKGIKLLGNIVSQGTIRPDPEKIISIQRYPPPTTIRELRSFLGMVNYCREFIFGFPIYFRLCTHYLKERLKIVRRQYVSL